MTECQVNELMNKVEAICTQYGAYCKVVLNKRPKLDHVFIEISANVDNKRKEN